MQLILCEGPGQGIVLVYDPLSNKLQSKRTITREEEKISLKITEFALSRQNVEKMLEII